MKTLRVDLPGRAYDIHIERGALDRAGELCRGVLPRCTRLFVVTDSNVARLHLGRVVKSLEEAGFETACQEIPAGESSKSPAMLTELWENMMDFGLTRTDAVVALGGGVVGDLAGFAAATILRGVDFIQIPTTLLAQVDSSVGGKVAVDLRAGKNLAGAFWQPKLVLMDPGGAGDPPRRRVLRRHGGGHQVRLHSGRRLLRFPGPAAQPGEIMAEIEHVLYTCCDLKRSVVVEDERDVGARLVLNFGHTLGHAYELAGNYTRWTHGQAVAAGMVRAAALGEKLGVTPAGTGERIAALLKAFALPTAIPCTAEEYAAAVGLDKKGSGGDIQVLLLEEMGKAVPHRMTKAALLEELK